MKDISTVKREEVRKLDVKKRRAITSNQSIKKNV